MYPEQDNSELVHRLLALKRHEQPPPGYFHHFSRQVIARIEAGERGEEAAILERLFGEPRWLQRLCGVFETRPAMAGALGFALCGFLVSGVVYSGSLEAPPEPMPGAVQLSWPSEASGGRAAVTLFPSTDVRAQVAPRDSLFLEFQRLQQQPRVLPVNFQLGH